MNKILWIVYLLLIPNFCAVAMDIKVRTKSFYPTEDMIIKAITAHLLQQQNITWELGAFLQCDKKNRPKKIKSPIHASIRLVKLVEEGKYVQVAQLLKKDKALRKYHPLGREMAYAFRQLDGIKKYEVVEGFYVTLPQKTAQWFQREAIETAQRANNHLFLLNISIAALEGDLFYIK